MPQQRSRTPDSVSGRPKPHEIRAPASDRRKDEKGAAVNAMRKIKTNKGGAAPPVLVPARCSGTVGQPRLRVKPPRIRPHLQPVEIAPSAAP